PSLDRRDQGGFCQSSNKMPRNLTSSVLAQLTSGKFSPALFVEIIFQNETVWLWSGVGTIMPEGTAGAETTFPYGQSWIGMGWLGQIPTVPEVTDVIAQNITLTLSGVPTELITDAINSVRQNSSATIWLGFLDPNNVV